MKKLHWLAAVGVLAAAGVLLQSCGFGVTIEDRLDFFVDDLNSTDRSGVYLNFHPDLTGDYNALKDPAFWGTSGDSTGGSFAQANMPYSLTGLAIADDSASGILIHRNDSGGSHMEFELARFGQDWHIRRLTYESLTIE